MRSQEIILLQDTDYSIQGQLCTHAAYYLIYIKEKECYDLVSLMSFDSFKCYDTRAGKKTVLNIALW